MSDNLIAQLTRGRSPDDLTRLHDRLVAEATKEGLVDVAYRTVDSPLGRLLVAATDAGVVRVAFELENHDAVVEALGGAIGSRVLRGGDRLDDVCRRLERYFAGEVTTIDVPVDLRLAHGFRLEVLQHLTAIPYGSTETYTEVATASGRPRAVRAVGTACATNPVPVIVPCHRVLRSDGSMGGYRGGLAAKTFLLDLESAA